MQIEISWLLQKPTDLDLHCLQMQDISGLSRTRVRIFLGEGNSSVYLQNVFLGKNNEKQISCCHFSWSCVHSYRWGGIHIIFFLFLYKYIWCGYSLEVPPRGTSNEYQQHMFSWRNKKDISIFWMKKALYLLLCVLVLYLWFLQFFMYFQLGPWGLWMLKGSCIEIWSHRISCCVIRQDRKILQPHRSH